MPPPRNEKADLAEARRLLKEVTDLERKARPMERLRTSPSNTDLAKCGEMMRDLQPQAEALADQTTKLPLRLRVDVGAAAGNMVLCASCKKDARDFCAMVKKSLDAASQELGE